MDTKSETIRPRNPFRKDKNVDYDFDSDDEWEVGEGEDLNDNSDKEEEEGEDVMDDEEDDKVKCQNCQKIHSTNSIFLLRNRNLRFQMDIFQQMKGTDLAKKQISL